MVCSNEYTMKVNCARRNGCFARTNSAHSIDMHDPVDDWFSSNVQMDKRVGDAVHCHDEHMCDNWPEVSGVSNDNACWLSPKFVVPKQNNIRTSWNAYAECRVGPRCACSMFVYGFPHRRPRIFPRDLIDSWILNGYRITVPCAENVKSYLIVEGRPAISRYCCLMQWLPGCFSKARWIIHYFPKIWFDSAFSIRILRKK